MNSFSTPNYKNDAETFSETNKLSSVILKCGDSGSARIVEGFFGLLPTSFPPINLNTSRLCNSCVKFNFTSNIIIDGTSSVIGTLNFQLYKICNNQIEATTVGPVWNFLPTPGRGYVISFSFQVCDCDICPCKECNYYVVVSPSITQGSVNITNATLSVIAVINSNVKLMKKSNIIDKDTSCFKHPLELSPVILKCRAPKSTSFPAGINRNIITTSTVASVAVNTSRFYNPCIRLEFTSTIIQPTNVVASMVFQIFKKCSNQSQPIQVGPQWHFEIGQRDSQFSFFVCDCNTCINECCTYTVQATAVVGIISNTSGFATVSNATLSALVVDTVNENC